MVSLYEFTRNKLIFIFIYQFILPFQLHHQALRVQPSTSEHRRCSGGAGAALIPP